MKRELCGVMKEVDKRTDEGVPRWFSHVEKMEKDRIAKTVYVGVYASSCSVCIGCGRDGLKP